MKRRKITKKEERTILRDASHARLAESIVELGEEMKRDARRIAEIAEMSPRKGTIYEKYDRQHVAHVLAHNRARLIAVADELKERIRLLDEGGALHVTRLLLILLLVSCASPPDMPEHDSGLASEDAEPLVPCSTNLECPSGYYCQRDFPINLCRASDAGYALDAGAVRDAEPDAENGFVDACSPPSIAPIWDGSSDTCTNFAPVDLRAEPLGCDLHVRTTVACYPSGSSTSTSVVSWSGSTGSTTRMFWCGNEYVCTFTASGPELRVSCVSGGAPCEMVFTRR